jgi:hypothetical protein
MPTYLSKRIQSFLNPDKKISEKDLKSANEAYIASIFCDFILGDNFTMSESPDAIIYKNKEILLVEISSAEFINYYKIPSMSEFIWKIRDSLCNNFSLSSLGEFGFDVSVKFNKDFLDNFLNKRSTRKDNRLISEIILSIELLLRNKNILKSSSTFTTEYNNFEICLTKSSYPRISVKYPTNIEDSYEFYLENIPKIIKDKSLKGYRNKFTEEFSKLILIIEISPLSFKVTDLVPFIKEIKFENSDFDEIYLYNEDSFYKIY